MASPYSAGLFEMRFSGNANCFLFQHSTACGSMQRPSK